MQQINLMPPGYAQQEHGRRRFIVAAAVMVALVMALVGIGRVIEKAAAEHQQAKSLLERNLEDLRHDRAEFAADQLRIKSLSERFTVIRTLNQNRRWASYLASIAQAAKSEVLLTRAKISPAQAHTDDSGMGGGKTAAPKTPPPPGAATTPKERDESKPEKLVLLLEGLALTNTDVTRFISALDETGIFEKVTFRGSQLSQINSKSVTRFELECPIRYEPQKPGIAVVRAADKPGPAPAVASAATPAAKGGGQ